MKKGVIAVISAACGAVVSAAGIVKAMQGQIDRWKDASWKYMDLYLMMDQWVKVKQEGKNLSEYFEARGYKKIAIYGMSDVGETLVEELKGTCTEVVYGIDRNADNLAPDIDVVSVDSRLDPVDAVVVTAVTFFDEIERKLSEKMDVPVLSLERILYEV